MLARLMIALLVIFFFADVLLTNLTFCYRDFSRYFYPLYQYGVLCLKQGIIPFWNPHIYCGMPFLALIQLAIFYPLSIIFYLFPFMFSLKLFIITHYFLGGVFIYLLMRHWEVDISSALISSISYTFSGYMLSCLDLINTLISAIWLPLIFLLYSKAVKRRSFLFTIFTGIVLGVQLLGGDPVVFYITLMVLFLFTCLHFSFKGFFRYLLAIIISIGLTLFQTLPFFELNLLSVRTKGVSFEEATSWSLSKYELLNLICPFFTNANNLLQQQFFESLAPGILPLFLTFIAIFFIPLKNRKLIIFLTVVLLCFLTLSLGKNLWVYKFFYEHLPLFNMFRYPVKFFCLVNFSISILAGFGFKYLLDNPRLKRYFLLIALSLMLVCIFCMFSGEEKFFLFKIVDKPLHNYIYSPLIGIFLLVGISFLIYVHNKRIKAQTFSFAITALVFLNLIIFGSEVNPVISQNLYRSIPITAQFINSENNFSRFLVNATTEKRYRSIVIKPFVATFRDLQSVLAPNTALYYFLFDAYGYEAIPVRDYERFIYYVKNEDLSKTLKLMAMINVRYIISEEPILVKGLKLKLKFKDGERIIRIYELLNVLPRAYLVSKVRVVNDRKNVFKALRSFSFNPRKEVILEEEVLLKNKAQSTKNKDYIKIIDYQPNKITLDVFSPCDSILFLSETYYPGWKAYLDGKETKIYRANYIFRAIKFPAGSHKVEFIYFPLTFKVGVLGSLVSLIFLVVSLVMTKKVD